MTNSTPWQTMINSNNTSKAVLTENNLIAVRKTAVSSKSSLTIAAKNVVMPKRYSFDDNGGGYLGL